MRASMIFGIIIVIFGLNILFDFPFFEVLFALLIIWLGYKMIIRSRKDFDSVGEKNMSEDFLNKVLVFSGLKTKFSSKNFQGGELVTVFGGIEIDATNSLSKEKEIDLDMTAVFGGITIKVPKDWKVKCEGIAMFGGYDNKTENPSKPSLIVHIKGAAIFGGVEIIN